jgi:predicted permease
MKRRRRGLFLPGSVQREVEQELEFHFASLVEDLERAGMSREAAEAEARRRFGDESRYRRRLERIDQGTRRYRRRRDGWTALESSMRYAWRAITRSPGLSLGIILAFALGIGANATMFGIVDRLLLSPPAHIVDADAVYRLAVDRYAGFSGERVQTATLAWGDFEQLAHAEQFTGVAAYTSQNVMLGRGDEARTAAAWMVTGNFFELLGVKPQIGRFFGPAEDRQGVAGVVVIGDALWRREYAGATSVLGETIDFGYGPYTIIGVAPRGFTGVGLARVDVWAPMQTAGRAAIGEEWFGPGFDYYFVRTVARLAPGASLGAAEAEATALHRAARAESIRTDNYDAQARVFGASLIVARSPIGGGGGRASGGVVTSGRSADGNVALWLAGVSAIVLLIACVNVANLLVARAIRQQRETGIRLAIGVTRQRLMSQTLLEGLLLAALGGTAAVLVARWGGDLVRSVLLPSVEFVPSSLLWRTIPVVIALSVLAGLLAALVPALETARGDVADTLRVSSGGVTRSASRVRGALSVLQAALSVVLLVGAGLFVRSLHNVRSLDLGFDMEGLLTALPVEDRAGLADADKRRFFDEAVARIRAFAGVQSAAYSVTMPFAWSWSYGLRVPGRDSLPRVTSGGPYVNAVSRAYLETMDLRVLRGRGFEDSDFGVTQRIALINEAMAKLYWPNEDPLGACLQIDSDDTEGVNLPCTTVVGVVENARRDNVIEEPNLQYYLPYTHDAVKHTPNVILIRAPAATAANVAAMRQAMLALEPRLRYVQVRPLADSTTGELRSWRMGATMFTVFGALALLVAAIGLYSVLAFDVAQRRREIGLRSALGAGTQRLAGLVVARALRLTVAGVALGGLVAILLAPRLRAMLYETSPRDPLTLVVVCLVLLLVAFLAASLPAWRAVRVDPNIALRAD